MAVNSLKSSYLGLGRSPTESMQTFYSTAMCWIVRAMKDVSKIYTTLLEKFGEPIGKQKATVGAADNGPQGKALWNDEPKKDREWSDPTVIDEADKKKKSKKMHSVNLKNGPRQSNKAKLQTIKLRI